MKFVPALELINAAAEGGYAVPSFCIWNAETMDVVLRVASDCKSPVMLMNGPGEFPLLSPAKTAATARAIAESYDIPAALHLDHGDSMVQVDDCLAAGYSSVMLDFSTRSFAENASSLAEVVAKAHPMGVTVEGEIGAVGRIDEVSGEGTEFCALTDPKEAKEYVERTGIDIVAVSIGNAHGNYPTRPQLDFELLATLRDATGVPIALHGGSGTPEEDLRKTISLGVAKVNIASELIRAVRQSLMDQWNAGQNQWTPGAMAVATETMAPIVEKWIKRTGAAGKA